MSAQSFRPGEVVYLQLWWASESAVERDWTIFTHVLGPQRPDGSPVWAGHDSQPGLGSVPTSTWEPGELILDEHQLQLPPDMPPGKYALEVGLYDQSTGERSMLVVSPVDDPDAPRETWEVADHVILGELKVIDGLGGES